MGALAAGGRDNFLSLVAGLPGRRFQAIAGGVPPGVSGHWFPTLSYGMEVKRGPPPGTEGWEWLFLRIEIGECIAGRYDMVVLIADGEGNVVAVSRHTALIISAERNYQGRLSKI